MGDKYVVTGDQYLSIDRKVSDIKRQLLLKGGSPLHPEAVDHAMQRIAEGDFGEASATAAKVEAALSRPYLTTIHYGRSPKTMAKAGEYPGGYSLCYDYMKWSEWKAPDGSELIVPKRGTVEKELLLFHLGAYFGDDHRPTSEEVSAVLVEHGLVVEIGQTVPALGARYPEPSSNFPVIALGSVWSDPYRFRTVAALWLSVGNRRLGLFRNPPNGYWRPDDRVVVSRA